MNTFPRAHLSAQPSRSASLTGFASVACALLAALVLAGCATTAADRSAKLLASTVQTVDVAMQGYAAAVVLDAVSLDDQAKVKKVYADYQAAVALAEAAITTAIHSGDAGSLAAATQLLTEQRDALLAFLARFTHAPPKL